MTSQRQRTELTVQEKLEIVKSLRNNSHTTKDLQEMYKVSKHTINRILINEDQLRNTKNFKKRRIRQGNNRLIDDAVSKWYHSMQQQNILVNGPLLRHQAVKFARMMNNHTFEANNGWLWRWQQKENVKFNSSRKRAAMSAIGETEKSLHSFGDSNPSGSWQPTGGDQQWKLSENTSVKSCGDSNASGTWRRTPQHIQEEGELLAHSEINVKEEVDVTQRNPFEADVVFDAESDEPDNCDNEDSQNTNYHLGLQNEQEEMKATTAFKCFVCHKMGEIIPFNDPSFDRCLKAIKFRRMKNLKYGEIILNDEARYKLGYHKSCYAYVIQMKPHWREEIQQMSQDITVIDDEDDGSLDHESLEEEVSLQHQPFQVKEEPNDYQPNESDDEESEKYRSPKRRKRVNEKDERDIYSIYGDYIARRLRASANERDNYEVYTAQHNIDDVIYKLSMGSYARVLPAPFENSENGQNRITDENRQNQAFPSIITSTNMTNGFLNP